MKRVLLLAVIVLGIAATVLIVDSKSKPTTLQSTTPISTPQSTTTDKIIVFICTSTNAYAYHIEGTCEYLNKCGCEIKAIPIEEAERMNRKPCKACTAR